MLMHIRHHVAQSIVKSFLIFCENQILLLLNATPKAVV